MMKAGVQEFRSSGGRRKKKEERNFSPAPLPSQG
jgi:hypothetical protein